MASNRALWILQVVFGVYFLITGISHYIVPEGLPSLMGWMYDLSDTLHLASGTAEVLGGLGLILPGLTKIKPQLTVWAASGLVLVMIGAAIWHAGQGGQGKNIAMNAVIAIIMGWIAYARAKKTPLASR